jgi:hypothetical protein
MNEIGKKLSIGMYFIKRIDPTLPIVWLSFFTSSFSPVAQSKLMLHLKYSNVSPVPRTRLSSLELEEKQQTVEPQSVARLFAS